MNPELFTAIVAAISKSLEELLKPQSLEDRMPCLSELKKLLSGLESGSASYQHIAAMLSTLEHSLLMDAQHVYSLHAGMLHALEADVAGVARFVAQHGLSVPESFIRAFNHVASQSNPPLAPIVVQPVTPKTEEVVALKPSKSKKGSSNGNEEVTAE